MGHLVNVDCADGWPRDVREVANRWADQLAGSTEYPSDLRISPEDDDEFRATLAGHKVVAYHCTRLLDNEAAAILDGGLRVLSIDLVEQRIQDAWHAGVLSDEERDALLAGNVFAVGNEEHRENLVHLFTSRLTFEEHVAGLWRPLATWGGEGIYFTGAGDELVDRLRSVGTPSIVVTGIDLSAGWETHRVSPGVLNGFVGRLLGLNDYGFQIAYSTAIPSGGVLQIWQPGDPQYDRHSELAKAVADS